MCRDITYSVTRTMTRGGSRSDRELTKDTLGQFEEKCSCHIKVRLQYDAILYNKAMKIAEHQILTILI